MRALIASLLLAATLAAAADNPAETELAARLDRKIDVVFRRDHLDEIAAELHHRCGLLVLFPESLARSFTFSLEQKQITVRELLERIAAQEKLVFACLGGRAALWRKTSAARLAAVNLRLASPQPAERFAAVVEIDWLGDPMLLPSLCKALSDADDTVAAAARDAILKRTIPFGFADAGPPEVEALKALVRTHMDPNGGGHPLLWVGKGAAGLEIIEALLPVVEAPRRVWLARMLGEFSGERAKKLLLELVRDADQNVKFSATYALANFNSPDVVPALENVARAEDMRPVVLNALARQGSRQAIGAIRELLRDLPPNSRRGLLHHLRGPAGSPATDLQHEWLTGADETLHVDAAVGLCRNGDPRGRAYILKTFKSMEQGEIIFDALRRAEAPEVLAALLKLGATDALNDGWLLRLGEPAAIDAALKRFDPKDAGMMQWQRDLFKTRDPRVEQILKAQLVTGTPSMKNSITTLLGRQRSDGAFEALSALLDATELGAFVARGLAETRDPRAVPLLIAAYEKLPAADLEPRVANLIREQIVQGLAEFGADPQVPAALKRWLDTAPPRHNRPLHEWCLATCDETERLRAMTRNEFKRVSEALARKKLKAPQSAPVPQPREKAPPGEF